MKFKSRGLTPLQGCLILLVFLVIGFGIYIALSWLLWNVLGVFVFGLTPLTGMQLVGLASILWILSVIFSSSSSK